MKTKLVIGTGPDWPSQKADQQKLRVGDEQAEVIGIDILPSFQPDIVRDILRGLPFNDNTFDEIQIHHVLEHVGGMAAMHPIDNYDFVMSEIHRVLKPGGTVDIEVPYRQDNIAYEAAGHVRFFELNSFMNYYHNPHAQAMGQVLFSKCEYANIEESGRSGNPDIPARVVRVVLKK